MATKPISLRVAEEVKLDLEQMARRFGTSAATLGADFVTQGVRAAKHPSIELRQTPVGRMAYIRGVRLPVWLAVETLEDCEGNSRKAARLLRLPELLFKAALAYAQAFPEEIAADRATGRQSTEELERFAESFIYPRVKARLLLDAHVPADLAKAVKRLCPQADIQHVSSWLDGKSH